MEAVEEVGDLGGVFKRESVRGIGIDVDERVSSGGGRTEQDVVASTASGVSEHGAPTEQHGDGYGLGGLFFIFVRPHHSEGIRILQSRRVGSSVRLICSVVMWGGGGWVVQRWGKIHERGHDLVVFG